MLIDEKELLMVSNGMMNAIHQDEVEIINELYHALLNGDKETVDKLLWLLLEDVEEHFSVEEEMMKEANFFAYTMHKAEHDSMRRELKEVAYIWSKGKDTKGLGEFLKDRLKPWLLLHIARWDATTALHIGA